MDQMLEKLLWDSLVGWGKAWSREELEHQELIWKNGRRTTWGGFVEEYVEQYAYSPPGRRSAGTRVRISRE